MSSSYEQKKMKGKSFRKAIRTQIREHKRAFIVLSVLRFLVIVVMVRQLMLQNYEGFFLCLLTLVLFYIPSIVAVTLRVDIPQTLEIIIFCFIFASEILGEINAFFVVIPFWDTILHTMTGFLAAAVGFSLVMVLNNNDRLQFDLSPIFLALVAFCFSMTIGVLWEFFEFASDWWFHTDMQKDTVVHAIYSVTLDPTNSNKVVGIQNIESAAVNGQDLGLGGYLDIGLVDTMEDLFVNFIGALTFSVYGYFYSKSKGTKDKGIRNFVLQPLSEERIARIEAEEAGEQLTESIPEPQGNEE